MTDVPAPIARSWARCAALGLDMCLDPDVEVMSYNKLLEIRDRNEELVRAASGELDLLGSDAHAVKGIVLLADPRGVILARAGSREFAEQASRVWLRPGVGWEEAAVGTNAIGTALAEKGEVSVAGSEHYFEKHRILSCAAAPIFDPSGAVVGVLDITTPADVPQVHTLALIKRATEQIERHLFDRRFSGHEQLHFHSEPSRLGSAHEAVLAVEDDCLVGANRNALSVLGLEWSDLGTKHFSELFDSDHVNIIRARSPGEASLKTTEGATLFARLQPPQRDRLRFRNAGGRGQQSVEFEPFFDDGTLKALGQATCLADASIPVLIQGESGTGKEVFARRLHAASGRREGPFVVVDCASEDEAGLATVLFGEAEVSSEQRRGKPGALRRADGGIVLLNEIGSLPLPLQARLTAVLRTISLQPEDGGPEKPIDIAVISTTRQQLGDLVAAGTFRQDLLALIAAYTIELKPLRLFANRSMLILAIWKQIVPPPHVEKLTPPLVAALTAYQWPGNFRQLVATLRALAVLAKAGAAVDLDALPRSIRDPRAPAAVDQPVGLDGDVGLETVTLAIMRAALTAEGGNVSRAARRLGIHRSTFYRRLFGSDQPNS
jgi:transcriptional regulator of acetoin/glycerol metabolism